MDDILRAALPAEPLAVYPYFDKVQVWLKHLADDATIAKLRRQCGYLFADNRHARFGQGYRRRIELKQPGDGALRGKETVTRARRGDREGADPLRRMARPEQDCLLQKSLLPHHRRTELPSPRVAPQRGRARPECRNSFRQGPAEVQPPPVLEEADAARRHRPGETRPAHQKPGQRYEEQDARHRQVRKGDDELRQKARLYGAEGLRDDPGGDR